MRERERARGLVLVLDFGWRSPPRARRELRCERSRRWREQSERVKGVKGGKETGAHSLRAGRQKREKSCHAGPNHSVGIRGGDE